MIHNLQQAIPFTNQIRFPLILTPPYTLPPTPPPISTNHQQLNQILQNPFNLTPLTQSLLQKTIPPFKQIQYQLIPHTADHPILVSNIQNF
ncbi:hypothetical protein, partial [Bacillus pumilus]|uniref:ATP-binding protein n=1 Tax=Bacillus pumilus TaxID=1408 RepID=UPI0034D962F4